MELTDDDKTHILNLSGTHGPEDAAVLWLLMMYDCTEAEASIAVKNFRDGLQSEDLASSPANTEPEHQYETDQQSSPHS